MQIQSINVLKKSLEFFEMISDAKQKALEQRMLALGILERDLEEHFIRSSGKGGQNVNKVSTCVWLKHVPSSVEVKCQKTRSQVDNRYLARVILCEKIEAQVLGKQSELERERHRIRKQKKRRTRRGKEKMLQEKKATSQKKQWRKSPGSSDY
jgi:protein subunit release factor B